MTKDEFINHLNEAQNILIELAAKQETLNSIKGKLQSAVDEEIKIRENMGCCFYLFVIIAIVLTIWVAISVGFGSFFGNGISQKNIIRICIIVVSIVMVIILRNIADKKNAPIADEYHDKNVEPIKKELAAQEALIQKFLQGAEMTNIKQFIPEEYLNLDAIGFLLRVTNAGRADNEKEAFNLYAEELHRREMQRMQQEQLQYAKKTFEEQQNQTKILEEQSRQMAYGNYINTMNYFENRKKK